MHVTTWRRFAIEPAKVETRAAAADCDVSLAADHKAHGGNERHVRYAPDLLVRLATSYGMDGTMLAMETGDP